MRLEPNSAAGVYNRGFSYRLMGRRDQAIADLTEAIRLDPKDADAFEERALAYYGQVDPDRGLADYAEAIRLNPKEPRLHNGRCYARVTTGRELPEAIADCTEALRLGPKYGLACRMADMPISGPASSISHWRTSRRGWRSATAPTRFTAAASPS